MIAGLAIGAGGLVAVGLALALNDPRKSEPSAVAMIPPIGSTGLESAAAPVAAPRGETQPPIDKTPTASVPRDAALGAGTGTLENGVRVVRGAMPGAASAVDSHAPLVIDVSRALDDPHRVGRVASVAPTQPGQTSPTAVEAAKPGAPRIAIYVGGMGLDTSATRTAIELMPAAVTLAFVARSETSAALVDDARTRGHEILVQIPMQNGSGLPSGETHALRPKQASGAVTADVDWLLGRFGGYDGVTNLFGAPVTADTSVMTSLLGALGGRHLFYLDDGTSKRSVALAVASGLGVPAMQADAILDATTDPAVVRANLEALTATARAKGQAIGMASGLPEHLAAIATYAAGLQAQGITLVPIAALVAPRPAATVAR